MTADARQRAIDALIAEVTTDMEYLAEDDGQGLTDRDRELIAAAVVTTRARLATPPAPDLRAALDVDRLAPHWHPDSATMGHCLYCGHEYGTPPGLPTAEELAQALTECAPARPGIYAEAEAVLHELRKNRAALAAETGEAE